MDSFIIKRNNGNQVHMLKRVPIILSLLVLMSVSINAQVSSECIYNCVIGCGQNCATVDCAQNCGYNCARQCGVPIGVEDLGPQCSATAPDGHPIQWDGIACRDTYETHDYCARAADCFSCQNLPAYSCVWNGGSCALCTSGNCNSFCPFNGNQDYYNNNQNAGN